MKNIALLLFCLLLSFITVAQEAAQIVKKNLKEVQMLMHLEDFMALHPLAMVADANENAGVIVLSESIKEGGIEAMNYYFQTMADIPLYRVEIQFDDSKRPEKTANALFGKPNHPNGISSCWLVYGGDENVFTLGFKRPTVAFAMDSTLTIWTGIDEPMLTDYLFSSIKNAPSVDLRLNKTTAKQPPVNYNAKDYADMLTKAIAMTQNGDYPIGTPLKKIATVLPDALEMPAFSKLKTDYIFYVKRGGLQSISLSHDNDEAKPLYELTFTFANADTLRQLAATLDQWTNGARHPNADNTWILDIRNNNVIYMIQIDKAAVYIAANLPNSEYVGSPLFELPKTFIEQFRATKKAAAEQADKK